MKSYELKDIVAAGGSIIVNATNYKGYELKDIAAAGVPKNGKLLIKKADILKGYECKDIAAANPGNVTFDFSE
jgi:hypothetical protein